MGALHTCGVSATGTPVGGAAYPMKSRSCVRPLLLPLLLSGCFSYLPLGAATPVRGRDVIARLSTPLAIPLQDVTVRQVTVTVGRVAYADTDSLVLVVERFTSDAGTDYPGLGTSVTIRRAQIGSLEERRVSKGRTILVLGGGVAAIVAIVYSVGPLLGSSAGAPPGPPPQP